MPIEPLVFDSVRFFDLASERPISIPGARQISDPAMIPLRGEYVRFEGVEGEFVVVDRHFEFRRGICSVLVNLQPTGRDI